MNRCGDTVTLPSTCLSPATHFIRYSVFSATAFPRNKLEKKKKSATRTTMMKLPLTLLICTIQLLTFAVPSLLASPSTQQAYPSITGFADDDDHSIHSCQETHSCGRKLSSSPPPPHKKEVYGNGKIIDISHQIRSDLPEFESSAGVGKLVSLHASMKNGSFANISKLKIITHTGTHLDAPSHFYDEYYDAGFDVDSLDLDVLNGPALLVDVPRDQNITAEVMEALHIPRGVRRVLFRTRNTDRGLMWRKEFDSSYTGFTKDGAKWLTENTDIKLVGIDYLSVATYDDLISAHLVFLKSREIILVEGLKLEDINLGLYSVHCLPLRLVGADGSPVRCILIK